MKNYLHFDIYDNRAEAVAGWAPDLVFSTSAVAYIPPEEQQGHFDMQCEPASKEGTQVGF